MRKNVFAVCDLEVDYACNFMDYINQKNNIPFEIHAFTTVESLLDYASKNHVELLLISGKTMCNKVRDLDIGKIIILSEGVHSPELDQYPSVYKYQSSANVIREVMACYGEERAVIPVQFPVLKKTTEILGIYSPVSRCLKTSLALTMGQILSKNKAVLYVNLEPDASFEELLGKEYAHTLSDLLYYARQGNKNLIHKLNGMIQTIGNLDYIPPVQAPADIYDTRWEDWESLINEIVRNSSYEVVILDIGQGVDELFQLLDRCKRIYMPILTDVISGCKIANFENMVRVWDYPQILARTKKIHLPFYVESSVDRYIERLVWSELGDYVRDMLREEQNEP